MISSAHSGVTWSPALQTNAATSLSSFSSCSCCSLRVSCTRVEHSPHGFSSCSLSSSPVPLPSPIPHQKPTSEVSTKNSASHNFNSVKCSSRSAGPPQSGIPPPKYQDQNRRIELKRFPVTLQNGEVRFWRTARVGNDSEVDSGNATEAQFSFTQTRRDILIKSSSAAGLALADFLSGGIRKEAAAASVSQRVRLKDVENQLLQDALRAAVAGDLENAETLFTELIRQEPTSASGWSNRGSVRISLGKFEQATNDFTKAIELAPEAPVPYLNRAISYEAQGLFNEAIADCKAAIENDPEEPAAWFNLGNVEARINNYDTSLVAYQRASILAPGIAGYRFRQALVLFQVDRLEEAKKLLQGLVRKYPNYTEAHAALAALFWKEGRRSSAEEQFTEATYQEPLYSRISWVETELQWPPGVFQAFAKFLSIDYTKS